MKRERFDRVRRRMVSPDGRGIGQEHTYIHDGGHKGKYGYRYLLKYIFKITLEDLIELLGAEAACKLIKYYNRCNLYIPSITTVQKRVEGTMMREEYAKLDKKGVGHMAILAYLSRKYKYDLATVRKRVSGGKNMQKFNLDVAADKHLVELLAQHYEVFKKYNII